MMHNIATLVPTTTTPTTALPQLKFVLLSTTDKTTFESAKQQCSSLNGDLPAPDDSTKNNELKDFLQTKFPSWEYVAAWLAFIKTQEYGVVKHYQSRKLPPLR